MQPLVSCIMPTYGRPPARLHLLQESVYWWTQQRYKNKELVILNDAGLQTLVCNVPGVRVINQKDKHKTLGGKYDALCELAKGEIILPWEDDDISLPHRIEQAVLKLATADYFNPQHTWYEASGNLHHDHTHGVCHNASAYRKTLWEKIGGYGPSTGNQDAVFDGKTHILDWIRRASPLACKRDWSYIYRWGVSDVHLSGFRDMDRGYRDVHAVPCMAVINPVMGRNYAEATVSMLDTVDCGNSCQCGKSG
jgi:glycosyltransferase involved in cell wall biosynthesis